MIENVLSVMNTANINSASVNPLKDLVANVSGKDIEEGIESFDTILKNLIDAEEGTQDIAGNPFLQTQGATSGLDGSALREMIIDLVGTENANQSSTNQILSGNIDNLDGAMIDMNEMNIAVQLTMQVRNKVIEAYQEIVRMQM
jgi:flagellar hook-basal body complex protein FliE